MVTITHYKIGRLMIVGVSRNSNAHYLTARIPSTAHPKISTLVHGAFRWHHPPMPVFRYDELPYHVCEVAPAGKVIDYIAVSSNFTAAKAAYVAILPERPGRHIQLTNRARIIMDSRAG